MAYEDPEDPETYEDCYSIYDLDVNLTSFENKIYDNICKVIRNSSYRDNDDHRTLTINDVFYQDLFSTVIETMMNTVKLPNVIVENDYLWEQISNGTFEALMLDATNTLPASIPSWVEEYCTENDITVVGEISYWS